MYEHLPDFSIVIIIQFIFFITQAFLMGKKEEILLSLKQGMIIGLPFGIAFDLIIGRFAGVFEYQIGFGIWFLIMNGIFSYGLMCANVLLLKDFSFNHVYLWSILLGGVYEIVNYLFPVWEWTFGSTNLEYSVVVLIAYTGLTWIMMFVLRIFFKINFRLIPF